MDGLDLSFYSENGYGKANVKTLKIHTNEKGIIGFGNNLKHTQATNFQNKVLKWQWIKIITHKIRRIIYE